MFFYLILWVLPLVGEHDCYWEEEKLSEYLDISLSALKDKIQLDAMF